MHCACPAKMHFCQGAESIVPDTKNDVQKWSEDGVPLRCFTSKRASRHSRVQLLISHPARSLCTRRFSEPTFRASGAAKHWKNAVFRDFSTFSRTLIDLLSTDSLVSNFSHICCCICPYVGSLTSKLPSVICVHWPWLP